MPLTQAKFDFIAANARESLRDALNMIAMHDAGLQEGRRDSFLNPPTLLIAVAAWERFIEDLVGASVLESWSTPGDWPMWKGPKIWPLDAQSGKVVWPKSKQSEDARGKHCAGRHPLDALLIDSGTLGTALTECWQAWVSTWYSGKRPAGWRFASNNEPDLEHGGVRQELRTGTETIFDALLSAASARDAAAHGLFDKKANDASTQGWYWWHSDADAREPRDDANRQLGAETVLKARVGRPSIQSGYVRRVTALIVQLIDCSITAVVRHHGWPESLRLPADWFEKTPAKGVRLAGVEIWSGETLHRLP
jgi:hypothetical protein